MRKRLLIRMAAAAVLVAQAGCLRPARPRLNLEEPTPTSGKLDLRPYIQAARFGEWVYERTELTDGQEANPVRYLRRVSADRLAEGILVSRSIAPLEQYLRHDTSAAATQPSEEARPAEPPPLPSRESPYLFELDEPLEPIPLALATTNPIVTTTALRYYGRRGRLESTGTMTRRVEVEGTQDVEVPAGRFANCLRVRLELEIRFPFGTHIDWNSYVWLSTQAGEVRRIEEFAGEFWIFGFGSAHEFRLVSYDHQAVQSRPAAASPKWARGLITLDRGIPRPRVSGAIVDFEESGDSP